MDINNKQQVSIDAIKHLAISDSGFIFDPTIGKSYTVNDSALWILKQIQQNNTVDTIEKNITEEFDVSKSQAERDLGEFFEQLNRYMH